MQDPDLMGVKRKYCEVEEPPCYLDQRQSILNISMCKLKTTSTKRVEPSLRRSVLIFNTLRYIEHELREEGVCSMGSTSFLPSLQPSCDLDPPPGAECTNQNDSSVCITRNAQFVSNQSLVSTTSNSEQLDISSSPCLGQRHDTDDVLSTLSVCSTSHSNSTTVSSLTHKTSITVNNNHIPYTQQAHMETVTSESSTGKQSSIETISTSAPTTNTSANNSNTDIFAMVNFTSLYEDSLSSNNAPPSQCAPLPVVTTTTTATTTQPLLKFEDILDLDVPMYDFDMFSPLSPSVKLTPLSAEDLIHALPSSGAFTDSLSTSCKNELLIDDLDHIMQILVGM